MELEMSVFETLNAINVNDKTEKKNGLTYLSWAWAWGETKKAYPNASYTVYENPDGWNYFTDGKTCWVKTGVCIEGQEHIEYLPVMNHSNKSIPLANVTSFDVNKAIQRSLTKAIARHGLGLYIYAGEDLPEDEQPEEKPQKPQSRTVEKANKNFQETFAPFDRDAAIKEINELVDLDMVKTACKHYKVALLSDMTDEQLKCTLKSARTRANEKAS